ncbi:MAG: hypothetical protein AAB693_02895 [Patescibacteria group bacterium]
MKEKIKEKTKKVSIEDLAIMTANGFNRIDKRFDSIDQRFDKIEGDIDVMKEDISVMKDDIEILKEDVETIKDRLVETNDRIDFLAKTRVSHEGHEILKSRVTRIEKFIKI